MLIINTVIKESNPFASWIQCNNGGGYSHPHYSGRVKFHSGRRVKFEILDTSCGDFGKRYNVSLGESHAYGGTMDGLNSLPVWAEELIEAVRLYIQKAGQSAIRNNELRKEFVEMYCGLPKDGVHEYQRSSWARTYYLPVHIFYGQWYAPTAPLP